MRFSDILTTELRIGGQSNGKIYSGWYIFEDGFRAWFHGMSKNELKWEIIKHGKLIKFIAD